MTRVKRNRKIAITERCFLNRDLLASRLLIPRLGLLRQLDGPGHEHKTAHSNLGRISLLQPHAVKAAIKVFLVNRGPALALELGTMLMVGLTEHLEGHPLEAHIFGDKRWVDA